MSLELFAEDTIVLIIDYQERLCAAMPPAVVEQNAANVARLSQGAAAVGAPVLVTEQYPRGLKHTIPAVADTLPEGTPVLAKTSFSAWRDPAVRAAIEASRRRQVVVVGMETHICVFQTARDLVAAGYTVHVPQDAVVSRTKANWKAGLRLLRGAGATITVTEAALFDWIKVGRGEAFKAISRLVK